MARNASISGSAGNQRLEASAGCMAAPFDPGFKLEATTATKVRGLRQLLDLLPYDADLVDANGNAGVRIIPQSDSTVVIGLVPQFYYGTGSDAINTDAMADQCGEAVDMCSTERTESVKASRIESATPVPANDYDRRNLWLTAYQMSFANVHDNRTATKDANAALAAYDSKFGG